MPISSPLGIDDEHPTSRAATDLGWPCQWCAAGREAGAPSGGRLVVCPSCGAASTDPPPSDEELELAYSDWYRPDEGRFVGPLDALLRFTRAGLAKRLDRIAPAGQILDVGSGDGALLDALSALGRDAIGIERTSSRPDVRAAELSELSGPFAAIVFWHSLEHLRDAGAALERAASLLSPGGVIVIAMPNAASLQAAVFGERWQALDLPRHLVHVPAPALLDRAGAVGLEVEGVGQFRGGQAVFGWLHGLVGSLPGKPDLYDAIRRPSARQKQFSARKRAFALASAVALTPLALTAALLEAALRRGGSIYVEARRV